jgi:GTP-binding protein
LLFAVSDPQNRAGTNSNSRHCHLRRRQAGDEAMLPVIALVGRPNVGKSTLFNALTRSRAALVADTPGLTRDRQYGFGRVGAPAYIVVDTGGMSGEADGLDGLMARQTLRALDEADAVVLLADARTGRTPADERAATLLRRRGQRVWLAVNKCEGLDPDLAVADFQALGLGEPRAISAAHGEGVAALIESVLAALPAAGTAAAAPEEGVRVAVIGRPNTGKSTLVNRLLGEERMLVYDEPGTTRDSVFVPFERDGRRYTLIDTAGVRRRARVEDAIEKWSVIKTLQALDGAHVVIGVLDARAGINEQDATLLGLCLERGRALVVAVNKWDGLAPEQRDETRRLLDVKLPFIGFARLHFISALHGTGVGDLMGSVDVAYAAAMRELPTPELTRVLQEAIVAHAPPMLRGRRPRLRYAHQGGRNPPVIVIHGTQAERVGDAYRRYLVNVFRERFELYGTPVRIEMRSTENPYAGRRNPLTSRQRRSRDRVVRHRKKT